MELFKCQHINLLNTYMGIHKYHNRHGWRKILFVEDFLNLLPHLLLILLQQFEHEFNKISILIIEIYQNTKMYKK